MPLKIVTFSLDVIYILFIILIPSHAYEWMSNIDPDMQQLPEDGLSDIRIVTTLVFLIFLLGLHTIQIVNKSSLKKDKIIHVILLVVISIAWLIKFV